MATPILRPGGEVFLDTSYALALAAPTDRHHAAALRLADELEAAAARLVTTRAVLLEIGNALSRQRYRAAAVELLRSIEADPTIATVPLAEDSYAEALELYCSRPDKEWGLVDCASFLVMTGRGITQALTADDHYRQAGFVALLCDPKG